MKKKKEKKKKKKEKKRLSAFSFGRSPSVYGKLLHLVVSLFSSLLDFRYIRKERK
jgi:hypothetical protein